MRINLHQTSNRLQCNVHVVATIVGVLVYLLATTFGVRVMKQASNLFQFVDIPQLPPGNHGDGITFFLPTASEYKTRRRGEDPGLYIPLHDLLCSHGTIAYQNLLQRFIIVWVKIAGATESFTSLNCYHTFHWQALPVV